MSTVIEKASPLDIGCWIEGSRGWHGTTRVIEIAQSYGMHLDVDAEMAVDAYDSGDDLGPDTIIPEIVYDIADEAERWLNEHVAPEGHSFGWCDGEFFLWTDEEWAADL